MKKIITLVSCIYFPFSFFAQQIRTIVTDSATYYIDTQTSSTFWGGAQYTGQSHVGTNTFAYSQFDGEGNTNQIVAALGTAENYPARRCSEMTLDNKSDWYLPSGDEIKMVYNEFNSLSVFPQGWYWTSSDHDNTPYTSFWTFDAWAWKKWFGGGEGNIYELALKVDVNSSFCMRKDLATSGIPTLIADKDREYKLYNLMGQEVEKTTNTLLLKKYANGTIEKVIYPEK